MAICLWTTNNEELTFDQSCVSHIPVDQCALVVCLAVHFHDHLVTHLPTSQLPSFLSYILPYFDFQDCLQGRPKFFFFANLLSSESDHGQIIPIPGSSTTADYGVSQPGPVKATDTE